MLLKTLCVDDGNWFVLIYSRIEWSKKKKLYSFLQTCGRLDWNKERKSVRKKQKRVGPALAQVQAPPRLSPWHLSSALCETSDVQEFSVKDSTHFWSPSSFPQGRILLAPDSLPLTSHSFTHFSIETRGELPRTKQEWFNLNFRGCIGHWIKN